MTTKIGVIPGDGIGPEVVGEALKVLDAAGFPHERETFDLGAEFFLRTGLVFPDRILEDMRTCDALLLGAVGDPRVPPGVLERDLLLKLRFSLDLAVNLRPVKLAPGVPTPLAGKGPDDIDLVVVRENVEGLYAGAGGFHRKGTAHEVATQESINTRSGVERVIRYAFGLALKRRAKLTLVHKTNVLTHAGDLWRRTFEEIAAEHPEVTTDYAHVDAACLYLVTAPERFDVIVTDNMFGDILTDLGAVIQGGMGIAAGGNINPNGVSMFEPIGGTAPSETGKGTINPLAAIGALMMLLRELGQDAAADRIDRGIAAAVGKMATMRAGQMGFSTSEVGDLVIEAAS
jgi:3-isopropylmalate dehydrogenase